MLTISFAVARQRRQVMTSLYRYRSQQLDWSWADIARSRRLLVGGMEVIVSAVRITISAVAENILLTG